MQKLKLLMLLVSITQTSLSQLVINEVDADTPGVDKAEIIEIRSDLPNFSTDGYVVVLFNGSTSGGDTSYYTIDLDGYTTDANHLLLIGSSQLTPAPDVVLDDNTIQNGADAVAIYSGSFEDFPLGTKATTTNLLDALVYDTDDPDDLGLLELLGETNQMNEDENNKKDEESIQRKEDGTYEVKFSTPGMPNDGSGIEFTTIFFEVEKDSYDEGETIPIKIKTDRPMEEDFSFEIELTNENFTVEDYSGNLQLTMLAGSSSAETNVIITDDFEDEGDETMLVRFASLPSNFKRSNDFIEIRIPDNDYQTMDWGTPMNPTYDKVSSTAPENYYSSLNGQSDDALQFAIQQIIADPAMVRSHTYEDVIDIIMQADQNPENSNQVWLLYTEEARSKSDFQWTNEQTGKWNREHVYPRSRGGYYSIEEDKIVDGIDVYTTTNVDSLRHGNSDAHGIRPVDARENGSRGNKNYGEYTGPENTAGSWKGDAARSIFFMTMRYKGIGVEEGFPEANNDGRIGDLSILLDWHQQDPPDDYEMNRNNVIYEWQKNRNPFIDHPDLVAYIWGEKKGEAWESSLSVNEIESNDFMIYPNPAGDHFWITTQKRLAQVTIYNMIGISVLRKTITGNSKIPLNLPSGMYMIRVKGGGNTSFKKIIKL